MMALAQALDRGRQRLRSPEQCGLGAGQYWQVVVIDHFEIDLRVRTAEAAQHTGELLPAKS